MESRYPTGQIATSRRSQRLFRSEAIRVEKSQGQSMYTKVGQMSSSFSYFWQKVRRIPRCCGASQSAIPTDKPTFTCQVDFHWSGFLPVIPSQSHRKDELPVHARQHRCDRPNVRLTLHVCATYNTKRYNLHRSSPCSPSHAVLKTPTQFLVNVRVATTLPMTYLTSSFSPSTEKVTVYGLSPSLWKTKASS